MKVRADRTTVVVAAVVLALIAAYAAAVALARRFNVSDTPSSAFSTSDDGLKTYHDYLGELGYEPRILRSFDELPGGTIVYAASVPAVQEPTEAERERVARWVRAGGRLVLAGQYAGELLEELGVGGSVLNRGDPHARLRPLLPAPYADGVGEAVLGEGRLLTEGPEWATHLKDLDGQGLVSASVGRGEVVWLADAFPMSNAGIGRAGNARLVTLLAAAGGGAEGSAGGGGIHFDEYHHGYVSGGGLLDRLGVAGRSAVALALLGAALALLAYGRRIGPAVPEHVVPEARGSGYIVQLAELYRKSGAHRVALQELEEGLRRALARRHGTLAAGLARHPAARDALEASRRLREGASEGAGRRAADRDAFLEAAGAIRAARIEAEGERWLTQER